MKGLLERTKVVLRHLPPTISEATLLEQIDTAFNGRYNWFSFRPGKSSQKHQSYSRAYIEFKKPEDVVEFAEFFNGHVFVNEKGSQFKAVVEYAPSQRVPKQLPKKDVREGTVVKDPEYLAFLEFIAKPVENLPSAEIQLERREAERAVAAKEAPIVTPLMDFVRQKRAAKVGSRRSMPTGKMSRRTGGSSGRIPSSATSKRNSEKRRVSTTMYVLRDPGRNTSGKDKSTNMVAPRRDGHQLSAAVNEVPELDNGVSGTTKFGEKKVLLLKGKEKVISHPESIPAVKNILGSPTIKQTPRREGSGRIVRTILSNKDTRQSSGPPYEQQMQTSNIEKDKRPSRSGHMQMLSKSTNGSPEGKVVGNDMHGFSGEKLEKRTRNKDRPDRGVWALRRSDGSYASDESLSSSVSQHGKSLLDLAEGSHGDAKVDVPNSRSGEVKIFGSGRGSYSSLDNGSHKHVGRRGPAHSVKDFDGSAVTGEGRHGKRGGASGFGSHEKQVWVQKSGAGS